MTENNKLMADADDYLSFTGGNSDSNTAGCEIDVVLASGMADDTTAKAILADFTTYYGDDEFEMEYYVNVVFAGASDANGVPQGNLKGMEPKAN